MTLLPLMMVHMVTMLDPACEFPPTGASQDCLDCMDLACGTYQSQWADCASLPPAERASCRSQAKTAYDTALLECPCTATFYAFASVMPERVVRRLDGLRL